MDSFLLELLAVVVCIVLSGLYSGSETALTSLGPTGAELLLEADPRLYRRLRLWAQKPYRVLSAILIGNNLVNITASALASHVAMRLFADDQGRTADVGVALALAIGVMTFLIVTFGEITPKIFSKAYHKRLVLTAAVVGTVSFHLFRPVVFVLYKFARLALKEDEVAEEARVTEAEIQALVTLGTRKGELSGPKERLLTSVFEYSETTAKEVMVPRVDVVAVPQDITFEELLNVVVETGFSRIPVYCGSIDEIVGIFYVKDMLRHFLAGKSAETFSLGDYLRDPVFVPSSKKVDELFAEFQQRRIHIAIAVDEFGGTDGVVTLEDIIEEFFGEIQDEYDHEEPLIKRVDDRTYVADARIDLDELGEELDLDFPDDIDIESLGGFLSDRLGAVPPPSSQTRFGNCVFTILESEPTRIVSVRIEMRERPETLETTPVEPGDEDPTAGATSVAV